MRAAALKHMWVELDGERITRKRDLPAKYHQFVDRHVERVSALQRARERWAPRAMAHAFVFSAFAGTVQIYSSVGTSTNTVPWDCAFLTVEAWGGGAGGGGAAASGTAGGGGGGGAGGYTITSRFNVAGQATKTFQVVVGGTGTGGAAVTNGGNGSSTTITAISVTGWNTVTCNGGTGGGAGASNGAGGVGGAGGGVTNTNAGSTNTTGASGGLRDNANGGGTGATGHAGGISGDGGPYGGGGRGGNVPSGLGVAGSAGAVVFSYAAS